MPKLGKDRATTIALLVTSVIVAIVAAYLLSGLIAFVDHYRLPDAGCNVRGASFSMLAGHVLILISLIVGVAQCVWRLVQRRSAWWIALITLGAVLLSAFMGFAAMSISAGVFG